MYALYTTKLYMHRPLIGFISVLLSKQHLVKIFLSVIITSNCEAADGVAESTSNGLIAPGSSLSILTFLGVSELTLGSLNEVLKHRCLGAA